MIKRLLSYCLTVLACSAAYGQSNNSYTGEIKKIANLIKASKNMSYHYVMSATYPNGQVDRISGEVYIGNSDKLMYNANDAFVMIYDRQWFYRASHRDKTVAIINIKNHLTQHFKEGLEKDMFQNSTAGIFMDSIITKYASIKRLKKSNDTVNISLGFPAAIAIKEIDIIYNEGEQKLIGYSMITFQPWEGSEYGKNKGTTQQVVCKDFAEVSDPARYQPGNFFSVVNNKVELKKYDKYKLNVKL